MNVLVLVRCDAAGLEEALPFENDCARGLIG